MPQKPYDVLRVFTNYVLRMPCDRRSPAGVVDEFYVAESGDRGRAVKAARKSVDALAEKLKTEGMMVEVEPLNLLQ